MPQGALAPLGGQPLPARQPVRPGATLVLKRDTWMYGKPITVFLGTHVPRSDFFSHTLDRRGHPILLAP